MSNRFRVYFKSGDVDAHCRIFECATIITALNQFHRTMQVVDKLAPDQYQIERACLVYNSDPSGNCKGVWIESDYDLPKTGNPEREQVLLPGEEQGLMAAILEEAQSKS